jgi:osmotically-inducible protein OsmY
MMKRRILFLAAALAPALALQGCAPLVAGGAATTAVVTNDQRTTGTVIEDQVIEGRASDFFKADAALAQQTRLSVTSYNQIVLVTGQAPTEDLRKRAVEYVSRIAKVRHVYNEVVIGSPITAVQRSNDALLTTKVKTKLFTIKDLSSSDVKVVTEDGVVFLMGLLDQPTGDAVAEVVAGVSGVRKVVKLFEPPTT